MTPLRVRLSRAALVGPLLAIAACGGGDDDASSTTSGETTGSVTTTASTDAASGDPGAVSGTDAAVSTSAVATTTEPLGVVTTVPADSTTLPTDPDPADSTTTTAPVAAPGADWEDPEGVFNIEFPSAPTEQNLSAELDDGTVVPVTAYLAEVGGAAAIVSCVATSTADVVDVDGSLLESQSQALAQFGAEVSDSTAIELQGRPGSSTAVRSVRPVPSSAGPTSTDPASATCSSSVNPRSSPTSLPLSSIRSSSSRRPHESSD
jgi:hypothetical protein